jgi:hypothetical protein
MHLHHAAAHRRRYPRVVTRPVTRILLAILLAAGLAALPGWTAGALGASCCGTDCSPCPLSFCKATRADRALLPPTAGLAPLAAVLIHPAPTAPLERAGLGALQRFSAPESFQPMRN